VSGSGSAGSAVVFGSLLALLGAGYISIDQKELFHRDEVEAKVSKIEPVLSNRNEVTWRFVHDGTTYTASAIEGRRWREIGETSSVWVDAEQPHNIVVGTRFERCTWAIAAAAIGAVLVCLGMLGSR